MKQVVPVSHSINTAPTAPVSVGEQGLKLSRNGVEIQVAPETDMQLLSKVLQVIAHAE